MNYNLQTNNSQTFSGIPIGISYQTSAFPISNQSIPTNEEILASNQSLRTNPVFVSCPGCRLIGPSKVIRNISISNLVIWCCLTPCWFVAKAYQIKEMNCFDADHYCHKCGNLIGKYESC